MASWILYSISLCFVLLVFALLCDLRAPHLSGTVRVSCACRQLLLSQADHEMLLSLV